MKKFLLSLTVFSLFWTLPSLAFDAKSILGIWSIEGSSKTYGAYSGELEIRQQRDGTLTATRVIDYKNNTFQNLKIQQIWTGQAHLMSNTFYVTYSLKQADYLSQLGSDKRTAEQFSTPLEVSTIYEDFDTQKKFTEFNLKSDSLSEKIHYSRYSLAAPLWQSQRSSFGYKSEEAPGVIQLADFLVIQGVTKDYRQDASLKNYVNRPAFKEQKQYFVSDSTDYEFYQKNKNILRVENKVLDTISLTESFVQRNAYVYSLAEKAQKFEDNLKFHINEQGMLSFAVFDDQNNFQDYAADGDSTLWTGMTISTFAMKYLATQDPAALVKIKKMTQALFDLIDITNDPQQFARTMMTYKPGMSIPDGWVRGQGKFSNVLWLKYGNNDMFKGLATGFLWAYLAVPEEDAEFQKSLQEHILKLLDLNIADDGSSNYSIASGLAALVTQNIENEQDYVTYERAFANQLSSLFNLEGGFYLGGTADWSGINLTMVTNTTQLLIAQQLLKNFNFEDQESDEVDEGSVRDRLKPHKFTRKSQIREVQDLLEKHKSILAQQWLTYLPTNRDFLTLATYAFVQKNGGTELLESKSSDWNSSLRLALVNLRDMPYPKPQYDARVDYTLKPDWSFSAWPAHPWKNIIGKIDMNEQRQGAYNYPVYEQQAWISNFYLKESPFSFETQMDRHLQKSGADYLYVYWMARWSGFLSAP